jgi:hypothetical protein
METTMTLKSTVSVGALALALGFGSPAIAQAPPGGRPPAAEPVAPAKVPVTGQILVQDANTVLAKQDLIGQTVYATDEAKIGSISDLIINKDGKNVEGFVIGVGGFLGIGEKNVALKMDRLKMAPSADGSLRLTMDAKKDELTNAPTFQSRKDQQAEQRRAAEPPAQRPMNPPAKSN